MPKPRSPQVEKTLRGLNTSKPAKEPKPAKELKESKSTKTKESKAKEPKPERSKISKKQEEMDEELKEYIDDEEQVYEVYETKNSDRDHEKIKNSDHEKIKNNRYPEAISKLLEISLMEADQVREAFKGRNRQNYVRIFQAYKDKMSERDYSIIRGATGYLYDHSRIKSIDEDTALWMLGIHEIPASQILSYTSKTILEKIAKDRGLSSSGKKSEILIQNIRSVIDSSK